MKPAVKGAGKRTARALLEKHDCPVPFHAGRTRFLGHVASPVISVSPLQIIKDLWGDEQPPFDSIDDLNLLLDALVQGLWDDLTRHQKRSQPFRLARPSTEPIAPCRGSACRDARHHGGHLRVDIQRSEC